MILAAAIKQLAEQRLVIAPSDIAQLNQDTQIQMALDEQGNFVITVKDNG